jgi:hypothetical protein
MMCLSWSHDLDGVSPGLCGGGEEKEDEFGSVGSVGGFCFASISAVLSH